MSPSETEREMGPSGSGVPCRIDTPKLSPAGGLDTSGVVPWCAAFPDGRVSYQWPDLTPFTQGALTKALEEFIRRLERLPLIANSEWPSFGPGDGNAPANVFTDRNGLRWDVVWHDGAWKRVESQTPGDLGTEPLGFRHLAPETLARFIEDGERATGELRLPNHETTGRDCWKARQAGRMKSFSPLTLFVADDGLIRIREGS